jgi:hypothetical protein
MNSARVADLEVPMRAVRADIGFLQTTTDRAYSYNYEPGDHEPPATATFATHRVVIRNARTEPRQLTLDEHGATLIEHRSGVRNFYDDEQITEVYYPEVAAAIKAATGADRVVVFDHNVRRGQSLTLKANGTELSHSDIYAYR